MWRKRVGLLFAWLQAQAMTNHNKQQFTTSIRLVFLSLLFMGCAKADVAPISPASVPTLKVASSNGTTKADSVKTVNYSPTETTNPEYWYNGTSGPALISVNCKDCSAIATIGTTTVPFMFNGEGVAYLKYTPQAGLNIKIAVCPTGTNTVKVDIFDATKASLFNYSGVITANWLSNFVVK
jgi:hypothetical protein